MKYNVHMYAVFRVRLDDIEASSPDEALAVAVDEFECRPIYHIHYSRSIEYDDELVGALVDDQEDIEHLNTAKYSKQQVDMARR